MAEPFIVPRLLEELLNVAEPFMVPRLLEEVLKVAEPLNVILFVDEPLNIKLVISNPSPPLIVPEIVPAHFMEPERMKVLLEAVVKMALPVIVPRL